MKKDVFISIKGIQRIDDEEDITEFYTDGNFYKKNNNYYITYNESEATGFKGSKTTVKIEGQEKVTLIRSGTVRSHLIVQNGTRNIGYYQTSSGNLVIGVNTRNIDTKLTDDGGDLFFSYSLDVNSSLLSENKVFINIKDSKKNGVKANG